MPLVLFADPQVTSWFTANADSFAEVREQTGSAPVTTWPAAGLPNQNQGGTTQAVPAYSDIQHIATNANNIYLESSGLASHIMGPWYTGNGNLFGRWPIDKANLIRITRNPVPATPATQDRTPLGSMGVFVNGAAMYNMLDAFSYSNAGGNDQSMGNGDGVWNRNAEPAEGPTFDPAGAHQPGNGTYHYHISPFGLRFQLGDNLSYNATTDSYAELASGFSHSPILGYAFDGYPVYGPYGYDNPNDPTSAVVRMGSGYVLRDGANGTTDLPATGRTTIPQWAADAYGTATALAANVFGPPFAGNRQLGWYTEDYDHLGDTGNPAGLTYHLDRHNGRFCVTPEYPAGTYAYFTTVDAAGDPAFPFVIGRLYYGERNGTANQNNIPANAVDYFTGGATPTYFDTSPPVITFTPPTVNVPLNGVFTEPGFSVADDVDCDIERLVTNNVTTALNLGVAGTYTVTYGVRDTAGNLGTAQRTVIVSGNGADTTPPVITLTGGTVTFVAGGSFSEPGFSALDNVDGDITANVTDDSATAVNPAVPGSYTVTYSVADMAGNPAMATRSVVVTAAPPNASGRKNVVLIAIDDLKPKIGAYGDTGMITPNLDAFAAAGVRFANTYCQYAICGPSRVSAFTGLRPDTLDIWDNNGASNFRTTTPNVVTLPQHFGANGYRTHGIGKLLHGNNNTSQDGAASYTDGWQNNGATRNFYGGTPTSGAWFDEDNGVNQAAATDIGEFNYRNTPPTPVQDNDYGDGLAADLAIGWLNTYEADYLANDQPFLLAVGFNKPHLPFAAPKPYWDLYNPATINLAAYTGVRTAPVNGANFTRPPFQELGNYNDQNGIPDVTEARHLIHGYMACVSYVDAQVGRVLDHLDNTLHPSVASNTIVVIYGDHGWHLGDHGGFWTKNSTFHEANHTVLMVRSPGVAPAVETQPVELLDIYPTLVDLTGLPEPAGQNLEGASLVKLMDQTTPDWGDIGAYYQFRKNINGTANNGQGMGWTIHTEQFRYTEWYTTNTNLQDQALSAVPSFVELYDHATDPGELVNVAGDPAYAAIAAELSTQLDAGNGWQEKENAPTVSLLGPDPLTVVQGMPFVDPGATATDAEDGALVPTNDAATAVNTAVVGSYTVTYGACDSTGLDATPVTRTVIVVAPADTTPPVITLVGGTVTVTVGQAYSEPGASALDAVDGPVAVTSDAAALNLGVPGTYTVTYTAVDSANNMATATRTVIVVAPPDTTPPVITLVGGTVTLFLGQAYTEPGASALDAVDGSVAVSSDAAALNVGIIGTGTVTYTALDSATNMASTTRTVIVVDGDPDGDGIPSSWEIAYGLDPLSNVGADGGTADNDGDGFTNLEEYIADTNPGDNAAYLSIKANEVATGHEVVFSARGSRLYTVQTTPDLTGAPVWVDVPALTDLAGTPDAAGEMRLIHAMATGDLRFYRVRVRVP